ncbi:MAG: cytoplasmic protein, partial [Bacteroidia bacterium]
MKNTIFLRRKNKVILAVGKNELAANYLTTLLKNIEILGYTLSDALMKRVLTLSVADLEVFYKALVKDLRQMTGAKVKFKPMYPNFPTQVMEASDAELYLNAIVHYLGDWIGARILPNYKKLKRE